MNLWEYVQGAAAMHVTNGVAASKTAAFLAVALAIGTALVAYRLLREGRSWDARRRANLFWCGVCMAGASLNRATVVLYYQSLIGSNNWAPTLGAILWAVGVIGFARSLTVDYCGNRGWLAVTAVSFLGFFFLG